MILKEFFQRIDAEVNDLKLLSEEKCLELLAAEKWKNGFACKKCGHTNYCSGSKPSSRRCTRCKHLESATAHTPFHNCRLPLNQAFMIAHEICCRPELSTYKLATSFETRQMTCWKLRKKLQEYTQSLTFSAFSKKSMHHR